jgi:hypothetical protein
MRCEKERPSDALALGFALSLLKRSDRRLRKRKDGSERKKKPAPGERVPDGDGRLADSGMDVKKVLDMDSDGARPAGFLGSSRDHIREPLISVKRRP